MNLVDALMEGDEDQRYFALRRLYMIYEREGTIPEVDPKYFQPGKRRDLYGMCAELARARKRQIRRAKRGLYDGI